MYLAFQKRPASIWEWLICWWTGGPHYHVALGFKNPEEPNCDTVYEAQAGVGTHVMIVSHFDLKEWDIVEIATTPEDEEQMHKFLASELGCKYDWFGLFMAQVLGLNWESDTKWFCSELAVAALHKAGLLLQWVPCAVSPNGLYKLVKKA